MHVLIYMFKLLFTHIVDAFLYFTGKIKRTSLYVLIRTRLFPFLLIAFAILFHGCVKDDLAFDKLEDSHWSPDIAVPLAHSSLSIADLMKNESDSGNLVIGTDNFCTLVYSSRALEMKAKDMFDVPNQDFIQVIQINDTIANYVNSNVTVSFNYFEDIDFSMPQGILLDSILFKTGMLDLNINSRIPANTDVTLSIPAVKKNGVPFSTSFQLNYQGSLPIHAEPIIDLEGYMANMTRNGTTHNKLRVNYAVRINTAGATVAASNKVNLNIHFNNLNFGKLFGYLGQQSILSQQDTINISLFNTLEGLGTFTIAEPEIKIDFVNSFGLPIRARVVEMKGLNGNLTDFVVANGIPNPLPIYSPNISQIGQELTGTFTMDKTNSNVVSMIANQPKYVISQVENLTNPNGNTGQNFVLDTSKFAVDMEVKMPLYGTATNFLMRDTVDFSYSNLDNVQSLMIRTTLENGFPIDTKFQVYFTDENFQTLDSLVYGDQLLMPSGVVDAVSGKVTSPTLKTTDHTLDRSRILKILAAKKIILKAQASSVNNSNTNVKIYADYQFKVNLGAIAKVTL